MSRKLTIDDIADMRAYEREREEFRERVIEVKRRRRVHVGTVITLMFENRDTVRLQIQEMARVEKLLTDQAIQTELDIYNPLIPDPGHLCATLFVELTSDDQMREWLPRLVGIERSFLLRLADGSEVRCKPEAQHEEQLTREDATAAVHYITFDFTPEQVAVAQHGPMTLVCDHPSYLEEVELAAETVEELASDLAA